MENRTLRRSGIEAAVEIPWGTHFCQFYRTQQDLVETLVPYFKAGLESNEFCVWVTSDSLRADEARERLAHEVPGCDRYFDQGQIEIHSARDWYLNDAGRLDTRTALARWVAREQSARERGFDGLRLTGDTCWLDQQDWRDFASYEDEVNRAFDRFRIVGLCTYRLDRCGADQVLDVIRSHQFAVARRSGDWDIVESASLKQAKSELDRANQRLRALADRLTRAEQRERRRIALMLHDGLQQTLVAAKMRIHRLDASGACEKIEELLNQALSECRTMTARLSPPVLYDLELRQALEWVVRRFEEQHQVRVDASVSVDREAPADEDFRAFLFEIVRELLFNAVKHAGVDQIELSVHLNGTLRICVRDQGRGCHPAEVLSRPADIRGFGLFHIRERIEHLGGTFRMESAPGAGCRVEVIAPLSADLDA